MPPRSTRIRSPAPALPSYYRDPESPHATFDTGDTRKMLAKEAKITRSIWRDRGARIEKYKHAVKMLQDEKAQAFREMKAWLSGRTELGDDEDLSVMTNYNSVCSKFTKMKRALTDVAMNA